MTREKCFYKRARIEYFSMPKRKCGKKKKKIKKEEEVLEEEEAEKLLEEFPEEEIPEEDEGMEWYYDEEGW